jgi:POT family proton-dependent oligopeptide transporter
VKFALGTIVVGLGFLLFLPIATAAPESAPLLALVGILFVFTIAELLLSPVGLSVSTKLAPAVYRTQMVALLFLASSLGTAMSGQLATFYSAENLVENIGYFSILGIISVAIGIALLLISRWVLKLMGGVR